MTMLDTDRRKLLALLDRLAQAVEELLLTGLTTASEATRQTLAVSFQEASRMRLLRLGGTLRVANEELGRFTRNDADFSRRRLAFFLNRAWLLSRGMARTLREEDEAEFERLLWTPASRPVKRLDVVTLGVSKKVAAGAFCAFEFRLRPVGGSGDLPAGRRLAWSCIFPVKPGAEIPPEGYLHLPQKQKFTAGVFLERKVVTIENAAVALDDAGGGRIGLGDDSAVQGGEAFDDWQAAFGTWDAAAAVERLVRHQPGPLDLEVELQEEIVLHDGRLGPPQAETGDGQAVFPLESRGIAFDAVASTSLEGKALRKALDGLRKKKRPPPLFGLLHYERCRLIVQPLSALGKDGPEYLTISNESVDRAALLRALRF